MKCTELPYKRPDIADICRQYREIAKAISEAADASEQLEQYKKAEALARHTSTQSALATIRHTVDTRDKFYEEENEFWDANSPALADANQAVARAMVESPFRAQLEEALGALTLEKMELDIKSQAPEVLDLMAEENALATEYQKLYASALIEFEGKKRTISELAAYKKHPDRAVRRAAYTAEGTWFDAHAAEFDELYDKLVKNRTQQARIMGYDNYVALGAIRMGRIGYTLDDMASVRAQIRRDVVPVVGHLKAMQHARTGVADPKLWDDVFQFPDGMAAPHGTPDEIMAAGKEMYHSLSPETSEFIDEMFEAECFDVLSKPGKAQGGYCTSLPEYKLPFIFSNFNGTADDVDVLTHEAGHAFADWIAARKDIPELLRNPGMESCEIHSMSMEFLTSDYYHLFYGEDTAKAMIAHAADSVYFLPYGSMVDEFQHIVYSNPDMTPAERNAAWAKLETEYRPWIDFGDLPFYGRGAGWQRQLHIYLYPFYYIDYCLAQVVALRFFAAWLEDKDDAWQRYLALVNKAGTLAYPQLVEAAGFGNPFADGFIAAAAEPVSAWVEEQEKLLK